MFQSTNRRQGRKGHENLVSTILILKGTTLSLPFAEITFEQSASSKANYCITANSPQKWKCFVLLYYGASPLKYYAS